MKKLVTEKIFVGNFVILLFERLNFRMDSMSPTWSKYYVFKPKLYWIMSMSQT